MRKNAESRLEMLKREVVTVEAELEEVRVEASIMGGQGRDAYQKQKELATVQQTLRRQKESAESHELLQKKGVEGIRHIGEMLGVPERDDSVPLVDLIKEIEAILDTLIEEKEKLENVNQAEGLPSRAPTAGKDLVSILISIYTSCDP